MDMEKLKKTIKEYCPAASFVFFAFALVSLVIWIVSEFSEPFSNFSTGM